MKTSWEYLMKTKELLLSIKKRLLLTGGCGFIGHHTVEHIMENTDWEVIIIDRLSYAGNQNFLVNMDNWEEYKNRVRFIYHDFRSPFSDLTKNLIGDVDYLVHMGAESHVDRSIENPMPFAESNVIGTVNVLDLANDLDVEKMIYISTDEVYGPAIDGHLHKEGEPHRPSNPYSASKSGAEAFCYAYWNTYGTPVMISNTMNNIGERQHPEKFLPLTVKKLLRGEPMIVHCKKDDEGNIVDISSRCWLHARNHADGILFLLEHGEPGERYNISGEWANVEMMVEKVADILNVEYEIVYEDFHSFRPGHDMHYGLDNTKMKEMGWTPPLSLDESLRNTVLWMKEHPKWLDW